MEYIKLYIKAHISGWKFYLATLLMIIPAAVSMLFGFFFAALGVDEMIATVIAVLIGGLVLSSPVLLLNHIIARDFVHNNKRGSIAKITFLNHIPSQILFTIIHAFILFNM